MTLDIRLDGDSLQRPLFVPGHMAADLVPVVLALPRFVGVPQCPWLKVLYHHDGDMKEVSKVHGRYHLSMISEHRKMRRISIIILSLLRDTRVLHEKTPSVHICASLPSQICLHITSNEYIQVSD